jgi:uncharacterized membrane protein
MQNIEKPQVRFGEWISEGWKMFTEQWKAWVLNTLIYGLVCGLPMMVVIFGFYGYLFVQVSQHPRSNQPIPPEAILTFYLIVFVVMFFTLFVAAFFTGGMHNAALKQLKGGKVELRDLFSGGGTYFPILISSILGAILTMVGIMLCVVPGFIVGGCLFFTAPLIIERKLGAIEAMKASYELTKNNILMFTLFAFVVQLIAQAGSYACYVGLLATIPLLFTITAVAYRDSFGVEGAQYFTQPSTPPQGGGYAQSLPEAYQPPTPSYGQAGFEPPSYGQAGFEPYPNSSYPPPQLNVETEQTSFSNPVEAPLSQTPTPTASDEPMQQPAPTEANQPSTSAVDEEPLLEISLVPQNVEQPKPPIDATMPLSSIISPTPPASGLTCAKCRMSLPDTAGFCPRCGTRVVP